MTHNMALCAVPRLLCHTDCFPDFPSGTLPPVAWQSVRQLDGIPHANPVAPPWVEMGRVNEFSLFSLRFQVC